MAEAPAAKLFFLFDLFGGQVGLIDFVDLKQNTFHKLDLRIFLDSAIVPHTYLLAS